MTDETVVEFPGGKNGLPEPAIEVKSASASSLYRWDCRHEEITLDEFSRTVICKKCGQVFDPFEYLMGYGKIVERAVGSYREYKRTLTVFAEKINELTKEKRRLDSLIKRRREKL